VVVASTIAVGGLFVWSPAGSAKTTGSTPAAAGVPSVSQPVATFEWIDRHENPAAGGTSRTGESHLLEALGHAAIGNGAHV
jgi:hypothetical protein